jgi:uncharacterized phage-like protein YoqJ
MSKICCITGHRELSHSNKYIIEKTLEVITDLIENEGVTDFRAGGAMGFDTLAAAAVAGLKVKYPHIKLHLIIPHHGHDRDFSEFYKKMFEFTLQNADTVTYIQKRYAPGVMQVRNAALVRGADVCVSYMTRLRGGTYQTVNMARRDKIKVINIGKR